MATFKSFLSCVVVEYSVSQQCFNKLTVDEMLIKNTRIVQNGLLVDFIPIAILESHAEADGFIAFLQTHLSELFGSEPVWNT